MGIFDDVKKAKNALCIHEEGLRTQQKKYDTLMKEIQECSSNLKQRKELLEAWQKYLNQRIGFIKVACKYDCSEIGPIIARLISHIEQQEYIYQKAMYTETESFSARWGTDKEYDEYEIYLVTKKTNARQYYEETKGSSYMLSSSNNLILRLNNILGNRIDSVSFYDSNINKAVDVKGFSYVYDFIDYVIERKIEKKVVKLPQEELEGLLNEFLSIYKKEDPNKKKMQ